MLPIPSVAYDFYPYNTIGKVTAPDGSVATGSVIANKLILTSASAFYPYIKEAGEGAVLTWRSSVGASESSRQVSVSTWVFFPGFKSEYESSESNSSGVKQKDLLILVLDEEIKDTVAAIINTENLSENAYRKVIGYAVDRYLPGDDNLLKMHATRAGEAVFTRFGNVSGRLFHTGDLKSQGAQGAPLYSFYDGAWSIDGFVVGHDVTNGGSFVLKADASVHDFIDNAVSKYAAEVSYPLEVDRAKDVNASYQGANVLELGFGTGCSIAPIEVADTDFHLLTIPTTGNYTIESFGNIDVSGILFNDVNQKIIDDDDSAGSVNYRIKVLLDAGEYYLKTNPYSTEVIGEYGISFTHDDSSETFEDDGFSGSSIMDLTLNVTDGKYRISESGEEDTFRVIVSTAGHFILWTEGSLDVSAKLFIPNPGVTAPVAENQIQSMIAVNDDAPGKGSGVLLDAFLPVGEYLVAIRARNAGEFGSYELSNRFHSSQIESGITAIEEGLANAIDFHIGEFVGTELKGFGGCDFYRFDVNRSIDVNFSLSAQSPIVVLLYDSDFNLIMDSESENVLQQVDQNLKAGRYYMIIASGEETAYTIE